MNTHDQAMIAIPGSHRPPLPQAKLLRQADTTQRIKVSIYARRNPRPPNASPASEDLFSTALPGKRKYLDQDQFNTLYGADPADLDKIVKWAQECHLKIVDRSVPKRRVLVEGAIGDINKAFGVQLNEYDHPKIGHYRGREGDVHVPSDLHGIVVGVFGLDTRPVGRPRRRKSNVKPVDWQTVHASGKAGGTAAKGSTPFPGTFYPPQVAGLYNYPARLDGSGQNVGIFAFNGQPRDAHGGYSAAALQTYFEKVLGGAMPSIKNVVVQGPGNDPGPDTPASDNGGDSTGEVMLDMCVVGSVARGANIFMYFTEFSSQGWVDALNEAITDDNQIAVISISYGNPEDDPQGAWTAMGVQQVNQVFEAAASKGITICCASGDDGSSDQVSKGAHVDFPASSPYVIGVGGTSLVASSGARPAISKETVWNDLLLAHPEGAGGGGISSVFSKPSYQDKVNVPVSANPPHTIGRGVPDVAAVADPETGVVIMHIDGKHLEPIGGTSAAAPMWASLIARLNQGLKARCGFLNPVLYTKCATGVLNDITVGNNGAYKAARGWDACTGLGSPQGNNLLQALSGTGSASAGVKSGSAGAKASARPKARSARKGASRSATKSRSGRK
jgi:kumamolisin